MDVSAVKKDYFYTYEDYCKINDDKRYEVINGVIYLMSPGANWKHQEISGGLYREFSVYLKGKKCQVFHPPFDLILPKKNETSKKASSIIQPDIFVVCDKNKLNRRGCFGSPDLIIEILSPSTAKRDLAEKYKLYQEHAVREYWVVDPVNQLIYRFHYDENSKEYNKAEYFTKDDIVTPIIFPDLQIKLDEVFVEEDDDD